MKRASKRKGKKQPTKEERAKAILESATLDDAAICRKYAISPRTWQRWLAEFREGSCPELTRVVAEKKAVLDREWAAEIPKALTACLGFLTRAAESRHGVDDPEKIHAVAGALKMITESDATYRFIDARISGQDGGGGKKDEPVPAGSNVTPIRRASG